jgi:hypothetical protein
MLESIDAGRVIVLVKSGSHLYGTSTRASDLDFKGVYVPTPKDILLQRIRASVRQNRQKEAGERNLPGDIDREFYSLQRFLGLLAEGQTVALDVLFAPPGSMSLPPAAEWQEIQRNRHRLLTRKSASFLSYCRQQANKYGIKGSRVATARGALARLTTLEAEHGSAAKLGQLAGAITDLAGEHSALVDITSGSGQQIRHWDVCGRRMPFTTSLKSCREVMQRLVDEYGQRALAAESQQGVDWKALSHAVRVGHQAVELLRTGHVTFPLPNATHILAIKKGELAYRQVAAEIEQLLAEVEAAAEASVLPPEPDHAWIEDFVLDVHRREVCRS